MKDNKKNKGIALANIWNRTSRLPFGRWIFSRLIGLKVPYSGSIGARVEQLRPGFARLTLKDKWRVRNHLNSIHAIALLNLGEMASGLALNIGLPNNVRGIVVKISIDYKKKARGKLVAQCQCDIPHVDESIDYFVTTNITDQEGDLVARTVVHWRLGLKDGGTHE